MATNNCITLKIYVPYENVDIIPVDSDSKTVKCLEMSTGSSKVEGFVSCKLSDNDTTTQVLSVSILNISFTKKMYQPNVVTAELYFKHKTADTNASSEKDLPKKEQIKKMFLNKQVELYCNGSTSLKVCDDYYVQKIEPRYTKTELYVTLTIYSPDYQMTIDKSCRSFVAKRLSDIMNDMKSSFAIPYKTGTAVTIDTSNMQHIKQSSKEHIFPYLVQYNESYYDFLKRTTNRWGEFLYYEDGKLNVGVNSSASATTVSEFNSRSYLAIDASAAKTNGGSMHPQATADANMLDNPMTKGEYDIVMGEMNSLIRIKRSPDKFIMKKISSLFGNNQSLGAWAINGLVDDIVSYNIAEVKSGQKNLKFNNKYFDDDDIKKKADQYGDSQKKFNQFSEYTPILGAKDYSNILKNELKAGCDNMKIDFQTTYPGLKLGQIIKVASEEYLVEEIKGYQPNSESIYYEATCLPKTESAFYPTYLETGHILESGIQHATVADADDPLRANRVRVRFDWQGSSDDASPWLLFAQEAATDGAGVLGRHYKDEKVLVDFINGNIERPYVIGAVNQKTPPALKVGSIALKSPAGQGLSVTDGTGAGITSFVAGVTPGIKMIQSMIPNLGFFSLFGDGVNEFSHRFEGSTEISDYYGIYSIKGSTDGRNVTIKSPWGDVKINAFTGITVSAPNGDIRLQGKNVTIEAGNNLKLISGTNIQNKFISRSTSSSHVGENIAAIMADAATIAAKKLQDLAMSLIDLSLIRNMLEVGFKPQEGLLEIQSNRYLKLEAGGAKAGYPLTAYASQEKLEKEFKESERNMLKMAPSIVELIGKIDPCVDSLISNYTSLYETCCKKKDEFSVAIRKLGLYSNTGEHFCNYYNDLKTKLWDKTTKEIKESDMGFKDDEVGIENNAVISAQCPGIRRLHFYTKNTEENQRKHVINKRKEHRKDVLEKANDLLKSIADFREVKIMNYQKTWDVNYFYGTFTRFVPKDFFDEFTKAFDIKRLDGIFFYENLFNAESDEFRSLTKEKTELFKNANHLTALKRKVALNMMDDWGINQQVNVRPKPVKPITEIQLLGNEYNNYVNSLIINQTSILSKDTGVIGSIGQTAIDKINFPRPILEYFSWGNSKEGKILFSDDSTYQLGKSNRHVTTRYAYGKFRVGDFGEENSQEIKDFMVPIRKALNAIGVVQQNENIPEGQNQGNNNGED